MTSQANQTIGVIGLGIMGTAYAHNLISAGFKVTGYDIDPARGQELTASGGLLCNSPADVAKQSDIILLALASVKELNDVCSGDNGLKDNVRSGSIICEMGTLPIAEKQRAKDVLEPRGVHVLDCPVSGTGAQAATGDLSIYVSGDGQASAIVQPVFKTMARDVRYVGAFGIGIRLKFVANLLVSIHNLASAEALLFAKQSGLDLNLVLDAITAGAGTSRMLEVRGPMMVEERYLPATMKMDVYMKDLQLIMDHARDVRCPTPLLAASLPFYNAAMAEGRDGEDTAALFGVLKNMTRPQTEE